MNVCVKLVSKMRVNRLNEIWKTIISPFQESFVPGRQSIDNIVLCQEFIHSLRYRTARKGGIIFKLDLEKSYGRLEWRFIEKTLIMAGIPSRTTSVIMKLTTSGSFKLLWNGEATNSIVPSRGLCHGDPLSPYIFVLCLESLGRQI